MVTSVHASMNHTGSSTGDDVTMNETVKNDVISQNNWEALLLLPLIVFGVVGNILVCMAVTMEKRLQSVTNYFLLSLAITDLLVCIVVWPFSILHEFMGYWPLNWVLCDFYMTSDVLMCTSSILHLCTISLERFLAIRSPLTSRSRSKTSVRIKILLVWVTSLVISSPIMILGIVNEAHILSNNQCVLQNSDYKIYGSVMAFYIPLIIMMVFFGLTIRLLRVQYNMCNPKQHREGELSIRRFQSRNKTMSLKKRLKQLQKEQSHRTKDIRKASTSSGTSGESPTKREQLEPLVNDSKGKRQATRPSARSTPSILPDMSCFVADESDYRLQLEEIHEHNVPISETEETPDILHRSQSTDTANTSLPSVSQQSSVELQTRRFSDMNDNEAKLTQTYSAPSGLHDLVKRHSGPSSPKAKKDSVKQKQEKNSVRTEQKASKTLGILFVCFVVCWGPFFIVNVLEVTCKSCTLTRLLFVSFVWLGYVSSILNPIIYTVFNKTFRVTMLKLLKCQYRAIQRPMRVKAICLGVNYNMPERTSPTNPAIPL